MEENVPTPQPKNKWAERLRGRSRMAVVSSTKARYWAMVTG